MSELYEDKERYLVYRLKDELYASPLLDFKEVIEYIKPKLVPNMPEFFSGMINLKGLIIGVIDLRLKLGIHEATLHKPSMLVCETEAGLLAAVVDKVEFVIYVTPSDIQDLKIEGKIQIDCLKGFLQHQDNLITIIDIKKFVSTIKDLNKDLQENIA
jgi:purine-binding chemotaxis protein CheW